MTGIDWTELAKIAAVFGVATGFAGATARALWGLVRRRRRADVLLRLAVIRTRGVDLRNAGATQVRTPAAFMTWEAEANHWDELAVAGLRSLAPHEAALFRTIDRFDVDIDVARWGNYLADTAIGHADGEQWHMRRVAMVAWRTRELKNISERYSATTSV